MLFWYLCLLHLTLYYPNVLSSQVLLLLIDCYHASSSYSVSDAHVQFLVVKRDREPHTWGFPITVRAEGEMMRKAAARAAAEFFGKGLKVRCVAILLFAAIRFFQEPFSFSL